MKSDLISVLIPDMPQLHDIEGYLRIIDREKRYSNFGILHDQLSTRLAHYFAISDNSICLVSNATLGLIAALSNSGLPKDTRVEVPAFTFTASVAAILGSSMKPVLVDVDDEFRAIPSRQQRVIMDVLPFGAELRNASWYEEFEFSVIDAAASFDSLKNMGKYFQPKARYAIVISLHATKLLGAGEGGIVISNDVELIKGIKNWSNFGFDVTTKERDSRYLGTNAKMSEYSCAVALASLDRWRKIRNEYKMNATLAVEFSRAAGLRVHSAMANGLATPYWIVFDESETRMQSLLEMSGRQSVETRKWWEEGCHKMKAYSKLERLMLDKTDHVAKRYLGLPFHNFLTKDDWKRIGALLSEI